MELLATIVDPCIMLDGSEVFDGLLEGDEVKVDIAGEEVLKKTCPAGKKWCVHVNIHIHCEDV